MKSLKVIAFLVGVFASANSIGQMVGVDAYLKGNYVEFGVRGDGGFEGVQTSVSPKPAGYSQRGVLSIYGIYANPQMNGWSGTAFDGDFMAQGSPENGWGFEVFDGLGNSDKKSNNCASPIDMSGSITSYISNPFYTTTVWEGNYAMSGFDLDFKIEYKINIGDLFYSTNVTITNNAATVVPDLYYYRNVDPDNNQSITGSGFVTTNTIMHNPPSADNKAQVVAKQFIPWTSAISFVGYGPNFRVSKGGFSNRDGSDVWNATAGLVGAVGSTSVADEAISIGYRVSSLAPGASESFHYFTVFADSLLDNNFETLDLIYEGAGTIIANDSLGDTVHACGPLNIIVNGYGAETYDWTWSPNTYLNHDTGLVVTSTPLDTITYLVTGTPTTTGTTQTFTVTVIPSVSPIISLTMPGPQCSTFDLSTLVFTDLAGVYNQSGYYSLPPSYAFDMSDTLASLIVTPYDSVYLMIADTNTGCYDIASVSIDWQDVLIDLNITTTACTSNTGTGSLTGITALSGTYDVMWSTGDTTLSVTGLSAGPISVSITGPGGCVTSVNDTILENTFETYLYANPAGCGNPTGSVIATMVGAMGNTYTYVWNTGDTSQNLSGVVGGLYDLTVTNQDGCTTFDTITVPNIVNPFMLTNSVFSASCGTCSNGTIYTFISGTPTMPVTYVWSTGDTTANLFALFPGTYYVTATDAIGCTYSDTFFVGYPDAVQELSTDFKLDVFPNPASEFVQINASVNMNLVQVFTIEGRTVLTSQVKSNKVKLDLSLLSKGVYSVTVVADGQTKIFKLIKN